MSRRGPYAKSSETKATIGRAALEVVREVGHKALTTAEVSRRAGVTDAARFYHFPTRDHLLVEALRAADAEATERMQHSSGRAGISLSNVPRLVGIAPFEKDPVGDLLSLMRGYAPDPEHPANEYFREHNEFALRSLEKGLHTWQEEGRAPADLDPRRTARQLLAAWTGLSHQWKVDPSFDLEVEIRMAFERLTGITEEMRG